MMKIFAKSTKKDDSADRISSTYEHWRTSSYKSSIVILINKDIKKQAFLYIRHLVFAPSNTIKLDFTENLSYFVFIKSLPFKEASSCICGSGYDFYFLPRTLKYYVYNYYHYADSQL